MVFKRDKKAKIKTYRYKKYTHISIERVALSRELFYELINIITQKKIVVAIESMKDMNTALSGDDLSRIRQSDLMTGRVVDEIVMLIDISELILLIDKIFECDIEQMRVVSIDDDKNSDYLFNSINNSNKLVKDGYTNMDIDINGPECEINISVNNSYIEEYGLREEVERIFTAK